MKLFTPQIEARYNQLQDAHATELDRTRNYSIPADERSQAYANLGNIKAQLIPLVKLKQLQAQLDEIIPQVELYKELKPVLVEALRGVLVEVAAFSVELTSDPSFWRELTKVKATLAYIAFESYINAGFTRDEALKLILAENTVSVVSGLVPKVQLNN